MRIRDAFVVGIVDKRALVSGTNEAGELVSFYLPVNAAARAFTRPDDTSPSDTAEEIDIDDSVELMPPTGLVRAGIRSGVPKDLKKAKKEKKEKDEP